MKIHIHVPAQRLDLADEAGNLLRSWPVSTALRGLGEQRGSYQTPRGRHYIRARIGDGAPLNAVFRARRPTGEIYSPSLGLAMPERDWILTRILWLCGREPGVNRLGECDSMRRYIYIHGTPDETFRPEPASHGCIRMRNADLVELFDLVPVGTEVMISDK